MNCRSGPYVPCKFLTQEVFRRCRCSLRMRRAVFLKPQPRPGRPPELTRLWNCATAVRAGRVAGLARRSPLWRGRCQHCCFRALGRPWRSWTRPCANWMERRTNPGWERTRSLPSPWQLPGPLPAIPESHCIPGSPVWQALSRGCPCRTSTCSTVESTLPTNSPFRNS